MLLALSPLLLLLLLSLATVSALNARSLDLSVTANALAAAYKDCTVGESCSLDVLDRFVVSAVAAFESGCSLNVLLMECDMEEDVDERLSDDDRRRRRAWLNAVSCTLTALNDANEIESRDVDLDGIKNDVARVLREQDRGLNFDQKLSAFEEGVPVHTDHLILLTMRTLCYNEGDENMPGAT